MLLTAWHGYIQKETDTEKSIYYDFIRLCDMYQYSTPPPEAVNTIHYILLRYYLKDLSVLKHVEIDTRYTLAKTSFAHPIQSRRKPLGARPPSHILAELGANSIPLNDLVL